MSLGTLLRVWERTEPEAPVIEDIDTTAPPLNKRTSITRQALIDLAERAIEETKQRHSLDPMIEREAMVVARSAQRISHEWWYADAKVGCLVGTILGGTPEEKAPANLQGQYSTLGHTFTIVGREVFPQGRVVTVTD